MRKLSASAASCLFACSSLPLSVPVFAAEGADSPVISEVLVTASKRGEVALLDTPMAIQAITGDQLEVQGVREFGDYARSISGLAFEDQGPGDKKIVLRGIQSTGAATTGQYFDDMVVTGSNRQDGGGRQPDIRLIDIERVEVLKGPQGTLYGASSMSGTIRMISNKPDSTKVSAAFNAGTSSTRNGDGLSHDFDAMLNVPLVDGKLALRVVGYQSDSAGFIDNDLLGDEGTNAQWVRGGRVALRWDISEDITLDAMWLNQKTNANGPAWYQPIFGEFTQNNHTSAPWEEAMDAVNLALNWRLDHGVISASASRMERDIFYRFPGTRILCSSFVGNGTLPGPLADCSLPNSDLLEATPRWSAEQPQDRTIDSAELRYGSLWGGPVQLVGGFFYQKESNNFQNRIMMVDLNDERIPLLSAINSARRVNNEIEQRAFFGELSYDITSALTATIGARAFRFDVDEVGQNLATRNRPVAQPPVRTTESEDGVTLKGNLQYTFDSGAILYANYAEGFRSGGINEPDFATGAIFPPFKSDSLSSYEIGAKGMFLDGTLQLEMAAYFMRWEDLQARIRANLVEGSFLITSNVGAADIKGVELGVVSRPFDSLDITLGGNLTVMEGLLTEDGPLGSGFDGDRMPNVPEFTTNVYGEYAFPVGNWDGTFRLDYSYVGDSYSDFNPTKPVYTRQGDYSLVNLRLNLDVDNYRFSAYVNNVLDELAWVSSSIDARRPVEVIPVRPRTIGLSVGYSF